MASRRPARTSSTPTNSSSTAVASDRGYVGSGYLEPYLTNTGLDDGRLRQTISTSSPTTKLPSTLLTQAYVPILPKHIWSQYTHGPDRPPERPGLLRERAIPGRRVRPVRRDQLGARPLHPDGAQSQLLGHAGRRRRAPLPDSSPSTDTMATALQERGARLRPGRSAPALFDALRTEPEHPHGRGLLERLHLPSFNTRGDPAGLQRLDLRAGGPGLPRCARLRDRPAGAGRPGPERPRRRRLDPRPAVPRQVARRAGQPARPSTSTRRTRGSTRRTTRAAPTVRRVDNEGKPIVLRLTWPDSEDHSQRRPVHPGLVGADRHRRRRLRDATRASSSRTCYGPEAGGEANWDAYIWGWVGDPDPTSLLSLFTTEADRGRRSTTASTRTRTMTSCSRSSCEATDEAARHRLIDRDAAAVLRRCLLPHPVLRQRPARDAHRQVHGLDQPAARSAARRSSATATPATWRSRTRAPGRRPARAATRPPGATAGPATPAPSGAPTGSTGGDSTPLIIGAIVLIAVIAGGFWFMRRRGPAVEEE